MTYTREINTAHFQNQPNNLPLSTLCEEATKNRIQLSTETKTLPKMQSRLVFLLRNFSRRCITYQTATTINKFYNGNPPILGGKRRRNTRLQGCVTSGEPSSVFLTDITSVQTIRAY